MQKLWAVTVREYLERVRTRWFAVATIFGPLVFGALIYLPAYVAARGRASADVSRIHILDATGTTLGRAVATELNGGVFGDSSRTQVIAVSLAELDASEAAASRDVLKRQIRGYLVLDSGTLAGRGARYAGSNATSIVDMRRIESAVNRELLAHQLRSAGVVEAGGGVQAGRADVVVLLGNIHLLL